MDNHTKMLHNMQLDETYEYIRRGTINVRNSKGRFPIFEMVLTSNFTAIKLLVEAGCNLNLQHEPDLYLITVALLKVQGVQNDKDDIDREKLSEAIRVLYYLIQRCDIHLRRSNGKTFLEHAVNIKNIQACKWLLDAGINVNSLGSNDIPAIYIAVMEEFYEGVGLLLQAGADPNVIISGMRPLYWAKLRNNLQIISLLLEYGAKD